MFLQQDGTLQRVSLFLLAQLEHWIRVIQIIRDTFLAFLDPPPSPICHLLTLVQPQFTSYMHLTTGNYCSKKGHKMSSDTLIDPLPPQCVIWRHCREPSAPLRVSRIIWMAPYLPGSFQNKFKIILSLKWLKFFHRRTNLKILRRAKSVRLSKELTKFAFFF
jgi:hypothetical protein